MPDYGDIVFTATKAYVAPYNPVTKVFGTPALVEYIQDASEEAQHDTNEIKAQGANREGLTVHIGTDIKVSEASLRDDAINIITGETATQSGESGNRVKTRIRKGGGAGLPYLGIILLFAATNGARYVYGAAKCLSGNKPQFSVSQNEFRKGEFSMKAFAIDGEVDNIDKSQKYEDASDVPDFSQQAAFQAYFTEILS